MSRIAYVNGRYITQRRAAVSIEDRGYQFADGVYEVVEVAGGALIDEALHLERLDRSLAALDLAAPLKPSALGLVLREIVRRNRVHDGMIYLQVTRGVARRDHAFPNPPVRPSLVVTARAANPLALQAKAECGINVITLPDLRWKRPDIKSISLLPNVLAKEQARRRGAAEAWLLGEDGLVKEGASSNAWIIDATGRAITHPVDQSVLKGVTRTTLLKLLQSLGVPVEERAFSLDEAYAAREAFITGATTLVTPVVAIDERMIGTGKPGALVLRLRQGFHSAAQKSAL